MKILSFCTLLLLSGTFAWATAAAADEYKLVWEDTFEGAALDETNTWTIEEMGDGGNNEYQRYRRENISVGADPKSGESCLIITAKKEDYGNYKFTSGRLKTSGKMAFKYGKIEGRIKLPSTANGLWPAFWMMGDDYSQVGWPKCGEIDILEAGDATGIGNGTQDRRFNGWFHWGESWNGGSYPNWGKAGANAYSIQDDEFHLFTLIWDKNSMKMYLDLDKDPDKEPYVEMGISGGDGPGQVGRYFHKPFYVIFNVAVGGNFTGITGNSNIPKVTALNEANNYEARMYVDYVRVYQRGDEGEEFHGKQQNSGLGENCFANNIYSIYPNPVADNIQIAGGELPLSISVLSMAGSVLKEFGAVNSIDVSDLQQGNYLLRVKTQDENVEIHRFVKLSK